MVISNKAVAILVYSLMFASEVKADGCETKVSVISTNTA